MNPERSDPSEKPRRGIARFLRGEVTDRYLGGVGSSAAAAPITIELNVGDRVTHVTDTIPALTTTIPDRTFDIARFVSDQITDVTHITPTITRTPDAIG